MKNFINHLTRLINSHVQVMQIGRSAGVVFTSQDLRDLLIQATRQSISQSPVAEVIALPLDPMLPCAATKEDGTVCGQPAPMGYVHQLEGNSAWQLFPMCAECTMRTAVDYATLPRLTMSRL